MTGMVENVAISLHELEGGHKWSDASDSEKRSAVRYARAAIEAMITPTEPMRNATYLNSWDADEVWSDMIQACLKEEGQ